MSERASEQVTDTRAGLGCSRRWRCKQAGRAARWWVQARRPPDYLHVADDGLEEASESAAFLLDHSLHFPSAVGGRGRELTLRGRRAGAGLLGRASLSLSRCVLWAEVSVPDRAGSLTPMGNNCNNDNNNKNARNARSLCEEPCSLLHWMLSSWPCKTPRDDRASSEHGCPGRHRQSPS